jgi:hypothetical protein
MYGWGWFWFSPFTEDYYLEEGSQSISTPGGSYSYNVEKKTVTISGYTFTASEVTISASGFEGGTSIKGTFVPSIPVPIYLKVGGVGQDYYSYYEVELTEIELE